MSDLTRQHIVTAGLAGPMNSPTLITFLPFPPPLPSSLPSPLSPPLPPPPPLLDRGFYPLSSAALLSPRGPRVVGRVGDLECLRCPVAGGPPSRSPLSTTNSMFALSYFPADERFLYSSDEGGNELTHIYVRRIRTARTRTSRRGEAQGELSRLGRRRSVVPRVDERARSSLLRSLRDRGRRLQATLLYREQRGSSSGRSRATSATSRW